MINTLFWRFAGLSLACSVVLLPLLLGARIIRRRYSARTCYFLWLLLALRMLLPVSVSLPAQAVTVEVPQYEVTLPARADMDMQAAPVKPQGAAQNGISSSSPDGNPSTSSVSLTRLLPGLWLAGMAGYGLWLAVSYILARRALVGKAASASPEDGALMDALSQELGCKRRPALYRSGRVHTPMLLGLVRPVVVLPDGEMPEEELALMLRHELTHLRRRDVAYKLLMQMARIVHWFNPLVWWMSREAGQNLELCCDGDVVRGRDGTFRRTYGDILLKTAAGAERAPVLSARMGGGKGYLKVRLNNLYIKKKKGTALVCIVLAAAVLGGSLVACTGELPEQKLDEDLKAAVQNGDWKAVVTSFHDTTDPEELREQLKMWDAVLRSCDNPDPGADIAPEDLEAMKKQVEEAIAKLEASLLNTIAIHDLAESVTVDGNGVVTFTIPANYQGQDEWNIEFTGRAEFDGFGGRSIHNALDRVKLTPGVHYTYDFSEQWSGITELYMSVKLGEESKDIDLKDVGKDNVPIQTGNSTPVLADAFDESGEVFYWRDKGGAFGDDIPGDRFYINLHKDGTFTYYVGAFSSYIGMGEWTQEGDTLCLADRGMQDRVDKFCFKIVDGALLFQKDGSANFAYVDVADGERFTRGPFEPIYTDPVEE